jgi:hypothetical protein
MPVFKTRLLAALLLIASLLITSAPAYAAQITFTVTAPSTFLYSGPSKSTTRVFSVFQGQSYAVLGRSADSAWLLLNFPFAAWIQANVGSLKGDLTSLPVSSGDTTPAAGAPAPAASAPTAPTTVSASGLLPPTRYKFTITAPSTYVRSGPDRGTAPVLSVFKGQVFAIRGRSADLGWLQVVLPGGPAQAWITAGAGKADVDLIKLPVAVPQAGGAAPSVTVSASASAPAFAGATPGGFELGGQVGGFDYPDKMKYAGMAWVKRQVRWAPGANADAGVINDAHGRGFKILLSVLGDPGSIAGGANFDDYARFVGDLARQGADGIEVWNEMNIDREWPAGDINPARYVELLRRAYGAIKAANDGTLVISGAPAPTGFFGGCSPTGCDDKPYIEGLVAAGGLNYMDCLGLHYNEGVVSPLQTSGDPRGNPNYYTRYYQTMVDTYFNAASGQKKLCFTELGYLSGEEWGSLPGGFSWFPPINMTVAQHAQYLGLAAQLSRDQGKVRLMIIFNVDLKTFGADPQAGYAIVRPNGSCPACETLRAVTGGR